MMYTVFIQIDARSRIIDVKSEAFLEDTQGWIPIARGEGDRYLHVGGYFPGGLTDERGVPRWKFEDGAVIQLTQEELDADYVPPQAAPTDKERIAALEKDNAALKERGDLLTACVLEMSEIIYA